MGATEACNTRATLVCMARNRSKHLDALAVAGLGTLIVFAYALFAAIQILWLNPLAAVPGKQLGQIWADLAAANESMNAPTVLAVLAIGPILAILVLVVTAVRKDASPLIVLVSYLVLLMLGAIGYFVASFGPGMSFADTYGISGGDYSPWAGPLYGVSVAALLSLGGVGLITLVRRIRHPSASRA